MKTLYHKNSANYPRLNTDTFFADYKNNYTYNDLFDNTFRFIENFQLTDRDLWARFVEQFRAHTDTDAGWRGEFWGKMMRGSSLVYAYSKDQKLYNILVETIHDMMSVADTDGRISSYSVETELDNWDIWCRKYVLLGMQYFLEVCEDTKLSYEIIKSMCNQVDYILKFIGDDKTPITEASHQWRGLNASSILEPVVRLYSLTKEQKYLDFATHIVNCGGTSIANIFDLAFKNELYPYQYPVTKAYEMISCFEGLLEYYRITGVEKYKTAVINFANKVLESDFTVIGSCGCTHELFDHSTVRQANTTNGDTMQETCVTVTLMKFMYQVHLLTGDAKYVDAFERSLYNAYLGAVNTEKIINPLILATRPNWIMKPLPFDSYSPLTKDTRGNAIGGLKKMPDYNYYGCCACIGAAGIGLVPKMHLLTTSDGFVMNLFIDGCVETPTEKNKIKFITKTDYPKRGHISITLILEEDERFSLKIRNPYWSKATEISVNSEIINPNEDYIDIDRIWKSGDVVDIKLDMQCIAIRPLPYGEDTLITDVDWEKDTVNPINDKEDPLAKHHIALQRGPLMLAQDNRLGYKLEDAVDILVNNGTVDAEIVENTSPYHNIIELKIPLKEGIMTVTDYASAGKRWTPDNEIAVWILTK